MPESPRDEGDGFLMRVGGGGNQYEVGKEVANPIAGLRKLEDAGPVADAVATCVFLSVAK